MARKSKTDWDDENILSIISNKKLSLKDMSEVLDEPIYTISRARKKKGIKVKSNMILEDRPLNNKERKARYNAKIREHKYQPIYKWE